MLLTAPQTKAEELSPKERVAASFRSGSGRDGRALPPLPVPPAAPGLGAHRAKGYRALESDRSKLPPLFPSPHSAALIALPAFFSPQRCRTSLEQTAEQQSPREGAESRSWNLRWLQLCQGPKRCRQRQQRPELRGEPCPFAPADPSAAPTPPPAASAEGTFSCKQRARGQPAALPALTSRLSRLLSMLRAIGRLRALRLLLLSQPRLSQWHHSPLLQTRPGPSGGTPFYTVPGCPPPPGQPGLAPPRRCRRALGLRAGASGRSLSAAPGMGIALARRARGGHAPHGGICPLLIDVFIQAGFWISPQEHSLKCAVEPWVAMGTPGGLRMKSLVQESCGGGRAGVLYAIQNSGNSVLKVVSSPLLRRGRKQGLVPIEGWEVL